MMVLAIMLVVMKIMFLIILRKITGATWLDGASRGLQHHHNPADQRRGKHLDQGQDQRQRQGQDRGQGQGQATRSPHSSADQFEIKALNSILEFKILGPKLFPKLFDPILETILLSGFKCHLNVPHTKTSLLCTSYLINRREKYIYFYVCKAIVYQM